MQIVKRTQIVWAVPLLLSVAVAGCSQQGERAGEVTGTNQAGPAPPSVTEPSEPVQAYVRAAHLVPGAGAVDVYFDGKVIANDLSFGNASRFVEVAPGKLNEANRHEVKVLSAQGRPIGETATVTLERGEDMTIAVSGTRANLAVLPVKHQSRGAATNEGKAKVMFFHADIAVPDVDVIIDGERYAEDIRPGQATEYAELEPGAHTLQVLYDKSLVGVIVPRPTPASGATPNATPDATPDATINATPDAMLNATPQATPRTTVAPTSLAVRELTMLTQRFTAAAGVVYSILIYRDMAGAPRLHLLEDKFVPTLIHAPEAGETPAAGS